MIRFLNKKIIILIFISILLISIQDTNGIVEIKSEKYYISSKGNDSIGEIKVQSI